MHFVVAVCIGAVPVRRCHGADLERERAFKTAPWFMKQRTAAFAAPLFKDSERASLTAKPRDIGQAEGVLSPRPNVA
jgi:hypothetical protein